MSDSVFVCGIDQEAGSSVVGLGLCHVLARSLDNLAFFKPVGCSQGDQDIAVVKQACPLCPAAPDNCSINLDEARELVSQQRQAEMLERIGESFRKVRSQARFTVVEGINNQRSLSVFDLAINEEIAAHLGAPVLLVARGSQVDGRTSVEQLVATVRTTIRSFEDKDVEVLGVVVNRVTDTDVDALRAKLAGAFEAAGVRLFGVLPALDYLGYPKLDQIVAALGAEVLRGEDLLQTVATQTIVAAMEPRNFLKYLDKDQTLVVVPGDRESILLAVACAQKAPSRRSVSGVVLTGGLETDSAILNLIRDLELPKFPVLRVAMDTYRTATMIDNLDVRIRPQDKDKIDTAASAVAQHLDVDALWTRLEMPRPPKRLGSKAFLETILEKSRQAQRRIVLPEGDEPRTLRAVGKLLEQNICPVTLLGEPDTIRTAAEDVGVKLNGNVEIIDPARSERLEEYINAVVELRKGKKGGMTPEVARQWVFESRIHYATLMVKLGHADGLVAGAVHSTGDTIRPAFQIIKVRPEVGLASSVFFMALRDRVLVYGDCAIVPNPNTEELAAIALASATTARAFGIEPRVAMLSYSTGKSGAGESVDKVAEATKLVKERNPNFAIDGPLQYDAAIDPDVGKLKQPDSPVAGQANVFIFPDLDAGNIAYKAVQRSAGAVAVGPVLQGLNKPVNDLSRGCTVDDIVYTVAVTAIQAI